MAHAGDIEKRPGTGCLQRRSGRVAGTDIIMRPLVAVWTLPHGARSLWEKLTSGLHILSTCHHCDWKAEQRPYRIGIDIRLTEAEGPRGHQIRHRLGAGIGADSHNHAIAIPK